LKELLLSRGINVDSYRYVLGNIETSFKSVSKYRPAKEYDSQILQKATAMLHASYSAVERGKLTEDYFHSFDQSSSPGYPYNKFGKKRDLLRDQKLVDNIQKNVKGNVIPNDNYWNLFVKSEPKKTEKIENHDERTVVGASLDLLAESVYLFGHMNANIYRAGKQHRIPSTVGATKFYRGHHKLYRRLTRGGLFTLGMDADYTEFDKRMIVMEFMVIANLRFSMLVPELQTEEMWKRISRYYWHVIYSKIVMETGDVIMKSCGNPSGQFNTITDNSMVNELRWYYLWCTITPETFHSLEIFRRHIELIVCGDDSAFGASPVGVHIFPTKKILEVGNAMGWGFKFISENYKPIHELVYCSTRFMWFQGHVVPVPDNPIKILVSLLYGSKNKEDCIREQLTRALNIRQDTFFLPKLRSVLEQYSYKIFSKYYLHLRKNPPEDMCSYDELLLLNRDFNSMLSLYIEENEDTFHCGTVLPFGNEHIVDL
jgi:hypothetical protein